MNEKRKSGLFGYLLLLTTLFILIEISLFIQSSEMYLDDFKSVSDQLVIPAKVVPGIVFFVGVQIGLHLLFTILVWALARILGSMWPCSWRTTEKIGFLLWFVGIAFVLCANQIYFPNSKFASLTHFIIPNGLAYVIFIVASIIIGLIAGLALLGIFLNAPRRMGGLVLVSVVCLFMHYRLTTPVLTDATTVDKPNIILIGIDSLRPDFLGFFGYEKHTPHIDKFLNQATVFADAFTPIARTFPAWVSILSGEYPKHNGVRFNLSEMNHFAWEKTLPSILRHHGYETFFATDETRFSNIDERYGFDRVVTAAPIGFNDFVLGTMNDFPISNLLVNTVLGKYLFPYSYGNRPAITTYNPDSFLALLQSSLTKPRTKPLFLAVHFCLPHYPYIWSAQRVHDKSLPNYQATIKRMDSQFNDFLKILQKNKLLEHSIIVLLSDHGEALELPGDRATEANLFISGLHNKKGIVPVFYPKNVHDETVNRSAGHGTDVLSLTQYHTVLAFRFYGIAKNLNKVIPGKVSLLDIKPTILQILKFPMARTDDGAALSASILKGAAPRTASTDFFMESDFSPQSIRSVHPEARQLLLETINFFQVDPVTTRLTVKDEMGKLIISSKQYADVYGDWILALYPQNPHVMMPILVNLQTGKWTNDLRTDFAMQSPSLLMLQRMKKFYGSDITSVQNIPA
ncbi:MAG: sulfatase-like hydrolase/transferase [Gammaproteobacteria bacterium]